MQFYFLATRNKESELQDAHNEEIVSQDEIVNSDTEEAAINVSNMPSTSQGITYQQKLYIFVYTVVANHLKL